MLLSGGAEEFAIVALVALIVVGPKDLPVLMRKVGQWVGKMRSLAAEFRSSFDELARQSELDELRKEVDALRHERLADPLADITPTFNEVGSSLDPSSFQIGDPHALPADEYAAATGDYSGDYSETPRYMSEPAPFIARPRSARKVSPALAASGPAPAQLTPKRKAPLRPAAIRPRPRRVALGAKA